MTALRAVPEPERPAALNEREQRVLALIAEGRETDEIATELGYSIRTIKNIAHDIMAKLHVHNRAHAVSEAYRRGLLGSTLPMTGVMSTLRRRMIELEQENASLRAMKADALQALLRER